LSWRVACLSVGMADLSAFNGFQNIYSSPQL